jgi:hypothetical protein
MPTNIPAYAAVYQESAFRFTARAVQMIWQERPTKFIRVETDESKARLYFRPVEIVEDKAQIWNVGGGAGHVFSRPAVNWIRFQVRWDSQRKLCYLQIVEAGE